MTILILYLILIHNNQTNEIYSCLRNSVHTDNMTLINPSAEDYVSQQMGTFVIAFILTS